MRRKFQDIAQKCYINRQIVEDHIHNKSIVITDNNLMDVYPHSENEIS